MPAERDSLLPLVAEVEKEIEALLATARREAEDILGAARREAAARVQAERAGFAAAEQAAYDEVLASGETALEELGRLRSSRLAALRSRIDNRLEDAVRAVVSLVLGDDGA